MMYEEIVLNFNIILRKVKMGFTDEMEKDAINRSIEEILDCTLTPDTIRKQLHSLKPMLK